MSSYISSPAPIVRSGSQQRQQSPRSTSWSDLPSRQSGQERINGILETARDRARDRGDTTSSHVSGYSPNMNFTRLPSPARRIGDSDARPDETTGIVTAQSNANYFSTGSSPNLRNRQVQSPGEQQPRRSEATNHGEQNSTAADDDDDGAGEEKSWLREYLGSIWSVELENKGSVARDHLALERTFLAWLRTSLAFASIGIAITQLFRLNLSLAEPNDEAQFQNLTHLGRPLGITFLAVSVLVLFLGYQRYFRGQQWVMKGKFPASRGSIILVTFVAFALMVISLGVVIFVQPSISR